MTEIAAIPPEMLYTLLKGKTIVLADTQMANAIQWKEKMGRVLESAAEGVLYQLALPETPSSDPQPVLFVAFDGTTRFDPVMPGMAKYEQITRDTPVLDVERNEFSTMGVFFPQYFDRPAAPVPPPPPPAPAPAPGTAPAQPAEPDWGVVFQPGTVFAIKASSHAGLARYTGMVFQSTHANNDGVLALAEMRYGLKEAVFFPFDGNTDFDVPAPAGTYQFATGIQSGQQVYNPAVSGYTTVETFYPDYLGIALTATLLSAWAAPCYYAPCYVPFGVAYDPFWVDPYWDYGYGYGYGCYW